MTEPAEKLVLKPGVVLPFFTPAGGGADADILDTHTCAQKHR